MTEKTRKQESGLIYIVQLVAFCILAYFIIFESHTPKFHIFNALNALSINSEDMMLLGNFGSESVMVLGSLKDTSLLDMVEIG